MNAMTPWAVALRSCALTYDPMTPLTMEMTLRVCASAFGHEGVDASDHLLAVLEDIEEEERHDCEADHQRHGVRDAAHRSPDDTPQAASASTLPLAATASSISVRSSTGTRST